MRVVLQIVSWLALAGTILPSVLFFLDRVTLEQVKTVMLVSTVAWFIATPLWMGRDKPTAEAPPA